MTTPPPTDPPAEPPVDRVERGIEAGRERAAASGDDLARALDRRRDELGMPPEPADGEDATT